MAGFALPDTYNGPVLTDTGDCVIASGASLSGVIDLKNLVMVGILVPSTWTTAVLTFQASPDGITFGNLQDKSGEVATGVIANGTAVFVALDPATFAGCRFLKVRSGTSGTPVNQASSATLVLVGRLI